MTRTLVDERIMHAPPAVCLRVAADVERWPIILPHYRWVRFHQRERGGGGRVEMAAWRDFLGPLRWPTWWLSLMRVDEREPAVHFEHIRGITSGMIVKWAFLPDAAGTRVRLTHTWAGPDWPLIGRLAWRAVIGPHFVSAIAQRTLAGVAREAEQLARTTVRSLQGELSRRRTSGSDSGPDQEGVGAQ